MKKKVVLLTTVELLGIIFIEGSLKGPLASLY